MRLRTIVERSATRPQRARQLKLVGTQPLGRANVHGWQAYDYEAAFGHIVCRFSSFCVKVVQQSASNTGANSHQSFPSPATNFLTARSVYCYSYHVWTSCAWHKVVCCLTMVGFQFGSVHAKPCKNDEMLQCWAYISLNAVRFSILYVNVQFHLFRAARTNCCRTKRHADFSCPVFTSNAILS